MVTTKQQALQITAKTRAGLEKIYGKRLSGVYLFGSAARGQIDENSDIDIAIILDEITNRFQEHERTSELGSDISLDAGILVSFFFISESDFLEGRYAAYRAVKREGLSAWHPTHANTSNPLKNFLRESEHLIAGAFHRGAVGRAYYAMFHAATAALLERGIERSSHHAIIAAFGESLVKSGTVDKKYHQYIREAFVLRNECDYLAFISTDEFQAQTNLQRAKEFVEICKKLCP